MSDIQTLERLHAMNEAITNFGVIGIDAKIDSQVLIQLLIQKGIITESEVLAMREKVKRNTSYGGLYDASTGMSLELAEQRKTVDALKRMLREGKDALTQEELDRVSNSLNEIINGGNQYDEEE